MATKPFPFSVCKECAGSGTGGADGLSAYEIALKNGFEGTEEEWLASLQGEQGPQGEDGVLEEITFDEMDTFYKGVAIVADDKDVLGEYNYGVRYFNRNILIASLEYDVADLYQDGNLHQDSNERYTQILLSADGSIKKRRFDLHSIYGNQWSEWEDVSVDVDLTDYVKNTDYANLTKAGVVKVDTDSVSGRGVYISNGILSIAPASPGIIAAKESYNRPITPAYLEHAVEVCTNQDSTATLTESQLKLPPSTQYLKDVVGDIETALDNIIAMQNSLIGGDSV